jgi:hypothetical protein
MAAINKPMLDVLKQILKERFVSHLPPLLGDAKEQDKKDKQISRAFSAFVMQSLFDLDNKKAAKTVVDDFDDNGIDAIYHFKSDDNEQDTLYLLQSKLKQDEQFSQDESLKFTQGVRLLLNQDFSTFNKNVKNRKDEIENALDQCSHIILIVAYVGEGVSLHAKQVLQQFTEADNLDDRLSKDIIYFSSSETESKLRQEQAIKPVNAKIKLQKWRKIEQPRMTVFGLVNLEELIELHNTYEKALYEKNIRYFIGAGRHGVNRAIKLTLEQNPQDFFYLNNGVTGIATKIAGKGDNNQCRTFQLFGLSIINGAQTVASAAQFKKENPNIDISSARVMLTLIEASEAGDFHKQVTRARNLQNPVDMSNFAALDNLQERLRQEMALYKIDYRYRPESSTKGDLSVIELEELARALACFDKDIRNSWLLKSEPSQFTYFEHTKYKAIFTNDLTGAYAINAIQAYRAIKTLLKSAENSSRSPEKLVYRHCFYALVFILMKQLKEKIKGVTVFSQQQFTQLISEDFDDLRQHCFDQYQKNYSYRAQHSFFKQGETASFIKNVMIASQSLMDDETVKNLVGRTTITDPHNQALINYLSGKAKQI